MKRPASRWFRLSASVVVSALFWYVALAVGGASALSYGVSLQFGSGYGLMSAGILSLVGSELVRSGLTRG